MEEKVSILKQEWFAVLMVVFVAPFGIFLIWKNKMFPIYARAILSVIFGIIFLFFLVFVRGAFILLTNNPASGNQKYGSSVTTVEKQSTGVIAVDQKGFYTYEDYNGDVCVMLYCSYVNNTNSPVKLTDISFGLSDTNGVTLGTSSETWIDYAPEIVSPGQKGYAVANASKNSGYKIKSLDEPTNIDVKVESEKAKNSDMTKILNTSDFGIQVGENDYSTTMSCVVENPSSDVAYYNVVVGGLYDSNSNLIGCLYNLTDQTQVGPNEKAKYSLNGWMAKSSIFQNAVKAEAAGRVNHYEKDTVKIN